MFNQAQHVQVTGGSFVSGENVHFHGSKTTGELCCLTCGSWLGSDDCEGLGRLYDESLPDAPYDSAAAESVVAALPRTRHSKVIDHFGAWLDKENPLRVLVFSGPRSNLGLLFSERLEEDV